VLSITTKAKARKDRKEGKINTEPDSATPKKKTKLRAQKKKMLKWLMVRQKKDKEEEKKVEEEPEFQELRNPTRVVK